MARPTTKDELLIRANEQFAKMWALIDTMADDEQIAAFQFGDGSGDKEAHWKRDKNLRDVLIHLYEWHQLLIHWVQANRSGEKRPFLPEPYNWKNYGEMNIEIIWKKHQNTPYRESKELLRNSHAKVLELVGGFSDDELFTKKVFPWTGGTTLGSYCISATASHYDWAMKKIKRHIKVLKGK